MRRIKWNWIISLLALALAVVGMTIRMVFAASAGTTLYVSPGGSDSNPGTQSMPVKTVQHAQSLVRSLNQSMTGDITVVLEDGIYRMSTPLTLNASDSGTGGFNVIWKAASGARPVLSGAVKVSGWSQSDTTKNIWLA